MKFVVTFSIRQPVLVNLLTVGIIIAGLVAWNRMPREVFPTLDRNQVVITTLYPGVAPEEVEQLVSIPIERSIATVDDVESVAVASSEGRSIITVEMKDGVKDPNRVFLDIQSAVARVSDLPADLPADPALRGIRRQVPVMWLALSAGLPEQELRGLANELNNDLEEIPGVSEALVYGIRKVQITILVDPVRLNAAGLSITEVMSAVRRKHVDVSGGSIRTQRGEYLIRTVGRFMGAEAVRHIVLKASPQGVITVGDVAEVTEGFEEATQESRVFGKRSVYAVVFKKEEADAIQVTGLVRAYIERTKDRYPEGAGMVVLWDSSVDIEKRQKTMYENGLMGLGLVIVLLFIFLDWRMALVTALGIPVAFFGTFVLMHWVLGITLNMITMFALIMVLGMLVDDAIIVVENFYRHLMMGKSRLMAALLGCREVVWPVIAAVSTTIVAYAMLAGLPGRMGQVLASMPVVATAALAVSVLEVLFILPSHLKEFARRPKGIPATSAQDEERLLVLADRGELEGLHGPKMGEEEASAHDARWFVAMQRGFGWFLRGLVRYWYVSMPVIVLAAALTGSRIFKDTRYQPFPQTTIDQFDIALELAVGTKLDRTVETVRELEEILASYPRSAVESYICDVGRVGMGRRQMRYGTHLAKCEVRMAESGKGTISAQELMRQLRPAVTQLPLLENFEFAMRHGGPDTGEPIQIEVRGNDDRVIQRIAEEIVSYGRTIPGVEDLRTDWESGKRELKVRVDEQRAARLGLDVATVGQAVRQAFGGGLAGRIQRGEDEIDVVVRFPDDQRQRLSDIESLLIRAPSGAMVPFRAVADIQEGVGPSTLMRVDRKRTITVYGSVDEKVISAERANRLLEKRSTGLQDQYPGYAVRQKGEQEEARKLQAGIWDAFYMGLLAIFIILATIFRSLLQPLAILMAVPFAGFGVIVGLKIHGMPMSLIGLLGAVALLGIVVNDSLVLVDFVNKGRARQIPLYSAAVGAGVKRLRPILLTSVTTVAGLLPLATGLFGSEEFLAPMAITIVWGLVFATLGTLLVVPCAVMWVDLVGRSLWAAIWRPREEQAAPDYLAVIVHSLVVGPLALLLFRKAARLPDVVVGLLVLGLLVVSVLGILAALRVRRRRRALVDEAARAGNEPADLSVDVELGRLSRRALWPAALGACAWTLVPLAAGILIRIHGAVT